MILASHFSFGSGGGVPAIGCGLGRVAVAVLLDLVEVLGAVRIPTFRLFQYKIIKKN